MEVVRRSRQNMMNYHVSIDIVNFLKRLCESGRILLSMLGWGQRVAYTT